MAAIFRSSANLVATLTLLGLAGLLICLIGWWWFSPRADYARHVDWIVDQPVRSAMSIMSPVWGSIADSAIPPWRFHPMRGCLQHTPA